MAFTNWAWIGAVHPAAIAHPSREGLLRQTVGAGRYDERLRSFWDRRQESKPRVRFTKDGQVKRIRRKRRKARNMSAARKAELMTQGYIVQADGSMVYAEWNKGE